MRKLYILLLVFCLLGCHTSPDKLHPGAINTFDSQAYDVLLEAQAVIQTGHDAFIEHQLTPNQINVLTKLENSYNVTREVYLTWHNDMLIKSSPSDPIANTDAIKQILEKDIADLAVTIAAFKQR